jgi:fumarate reductase flavoprotein subunit
MVGLDPTELSATVERYNSFVDDGADLDFGRRTLGKGYGRIVRIATPPFYILPCAAALFTTYGGLKVNDRMQVVAITGEPIEGLYAVGEVIGGFHGQGYMSGSALGKAAIFGKVAGALLGHS